MVHIAWVCGTIQITISGPSGPRRTGPASLVPRHLRAKRVPPLSLPPLTSLLNVAPVPASPRPPAPFLNASRSCTFPAPFCRINGPNPKTRGANRLVSPLRFRRCAYCSWFGKLPDFRLRPLRPSPNRSHTPPTAQIGGPTLLPAPSYLLCDVFRLLPALYRPNHRLLHPSLIPALPAPISPNQRLKSKIEKYHSTRLDQTVPAMCIL